MKRVLPSLLLLTLALVLVGLSAPSVRTSARVAHIRRAITGARPHTESAAGTLGLLASVLPTTRITAAPFRDLADIRARLLTNEPGTYIDDILLERDSALVRWPDRHGRPLIVWIQQQSPAPDFSTRLADEAREAFIEWDAVGLPIQFAFSTDSARSDVHVTWIDHFTEPISGRTRWARDDDYFITDANITLAVHHNQGEALDDEAMKAMALHEIGHLLGLDHTRDASAIMAPRVRVRALSDADRATARLLYTLPAGPLR